MNEKCFNGSDNRTPPSVCPAGGNHRCRLCYQLTPVPLVHYLRTATRCRIRIEAGSLKYRVMIIAYITIICCGILLDGLSCRHYMD